MKNIKHCTLLAAFTFLGGCALAGVDPGVSQADESLTAAGAPVEVETVCPFVGDCYIEHQNSVEDQNSYCRQGCNGPAICQHILQGKCDILNGNPVGPDGKLAHSLLPGQVADPLACYIIGRCERSLGPK